MGVTFLDVAVSNPARPERARTFACLVDSGAVYSVLPAAALRRLGIKPTSAEEFILANGERIRKAVGNAYFHYRGKVRAAPVIFGDRDVFLLGATTLEALGLVLDPIHRELRPLPMLMMPLRRRRSRRRVHDFMSRGAKERGRSRVS